jgi:cell wall-associated NlpC family hydrolase
MMAAVMTDPHYPAALPAMPAPAAMTPATQGSLPPVRMRSGVVLASALAVLLLAGCGREATRPDVPATGHWPQVVPADAASANAVTLRALSLVGTPYRYGGNTPDSGFDCSGLVNYVYRDMLDLRLPRSSGELAGLQGPPLPPQRLASGDLVFFGSRGSVSHVGIYVGEGRFVHAPSSGGTVRLDRLDGPYWRDHYSGAKRVLR